MDNGPTLPAFGPGRTAFAFGMPRKKAPIFLVLDAVHHKVVQLFTVLVAEELVAELGAEQLFFAVEISQIAPACPSSRLADDPAVGAFHGLAEHSSDRFRLAWMPPIKAYMV